MIRSSANLLRFISGPLPWSGFQLPVKEKQMVTSVRPNPWLAPSAPGCSCRSACRSRRPRSLRAGSERDQAPSRTGSSRASAAGSIDAATTTRRPLASTISSFVSGSEPVDVTEAGSATTATGANSGSDLCRAARRESRRDTRPATAPEAAARSHAAAPSPIRPAGGQSSPRGCGSSPSPSSDGAGRCPLRPAPRPADYSYGRP